MMAQSVILDSVVVADDIPIIKSVSAPNLSGTLTIQLPDDYPEQMIYELPAVTLDVYILSKDGEYSRYMSVSVTMTTRFNKTYSIPLYSLPNEFKFYITPEYDKNALTAHDNLCKTTLTENTWGDATEEFPIKILFDDAKVQGGGTGGGGGEVDPEHKPATEPLSVDYVLSASSWVGNKYTIQNANFRNADINICLAVGDTAEQYNSAAYAKIACESQINDTITLVAHGVVPDIDIPINISFTGYNDTGMIDVVTISKWADITPESDKTYIIIDDYD